MRSDESFSTVEGERNDPGAKRIGGIGTASTTTRSWLLVMLFLLAFLFYVWNTGVLGDNLSSLRLPVKIVFEEPSNHHPSPRGKLDGTEDQNQGGETETTMSTSTNTLHTGQGPPSAVVVTHTLTQPAPSSSVSASANGTHHDRDSDCDSLGVTMPPVHFAQVFVKFVGFVPLSDIEQAMYDLRKLDGLGVKYFALDGTLLNLLRWGRVVNDNDVDIGFVVESVSIANVSGQYWEMQERLAEAGIIDPLTSRERKKLYHRTKMVKPGKCKYRKRIMQCRHPNGVIYDMFGAESLFHPTLSVWRSLKDIQQNEATIRKDNPKFSAPRNISSESSSLAFVQCKSFNVTFPCPANPLHTLTTFTLDVQTDPSGPPVGSYEFQGCSLYSRRQDEYTSAHLDHLDATARLLDRCGHPSMISEIDENPDCVKIREKQRERGV